MPLGSSRQRKTFAKVKESPSLAPFWVHQGEEVFAEVNLHQAFGHTLRFSEAKGPSPRQTPRDFSDYGSFAKAKDFLPRRRGSLLGHFKCKTHFIFSFHYIFPAFPLQELGLSKSVFPSLFLHGPEENRPREEEEDRLELLRTFSSSRQFQEVYHIGSGEAVP